MSAIFFSVFYSFGLAVFLLGVQSLVFFPLTIAYEIWKRRALKALPEFTGKVSVIVPAYNEEKTIHSSLSTLLKSNYPNLEVIVVNDGSSDQTERCIEDFIASKRIIYIKQQNAGKASALNHGISMASGEVILYTDADSLFLPETISQMVRWFADPAIDAVCGNDMPLNPQNAIHRFLVITTHIGTGFVRRALSIIGCLPIISGNLGAIRKKTLDEIGGFVNMWGEDLEITFRLHKFGKRIIFDPQPKVVAECPGTLRALWKQRVRWVRSYFKIVIYHRALFFSPRHAPFSWYLPINFLNMGVVPLLQLLLLIGLPFAYMYGLTQFNGWVDIMVFLGFFTFILVAVYSTVLDKSHTDLKYLPYGFLVIPMSYFYNLVVAHSWWKELRQAEETWHKSERRDIQQQVSPHGIHRQQIAVIVPALTLLLPIAMVLLLPVATYMISHPTNRAAPIAPAALLGQKQEAQLNFALATHFEAWPDWHDAINKVISRPMVDKIGVIGIGAGRLEWTYFQWDAYKANWASQQKKESRDMLREAAIAFHAKGAKVAAMVDLFAPTYIALNPKAAAVRFDGEPSTDQVSLVELTQGRYGKRLIAMIDYIAANYPVDIVSLTEVPYYSFSYSDEDLDSFRRSSGQLDWPRDSSGKIDRNNRKIWEWKNELMEGYIRQVADAVHRYGKTLYVDVPVSWNNFANEGKEAGLDYRRMLKHADKIVLWNYYLLEDKPPESSRDLSQYMSQNFPPDSYYISIGLWGETSTVDAASLGSAIHSTLEGGSDRIWITPNHMLSDDHWRQVARHLTETEAP